MPLERFDIPANLTFEELSKTEIRIKWDAVTDADGYKVALHDESGAEIASQDVSVTQADFTGLSEAVFYRADVRAYDSGGNETFPGSVYAWISPGRHSSAVQAAPSFIQGSFTLLFRPFQKLMKPLRNFPDYWRFVDTLSFVDGPDVEDGQFSRDRLTWRAEISGSDSSLIELFNEQEFSDVAAAESVQHDKEVVSVSIEFDQSGKFLVVFEDIDGLIQLNWFDPQVGNRVIEEMEAGRTPAFASTRYDKRFGGESERLFFYVRANDDHVVFRRQSERWGMVHALPAAPGPVAELLNVGKTMYGGMLVAAAYDAGNGVAETVYWNAPDTRGVVWNTDRDNVDQLTLQPSGVVNSIAAFDATKLLQLDADQLSLSVAGVVNDITVVLKEVVLSDPNITADQLTLSNSGIVNQILLEDKVINLTDPNITADQLTLSNSGVVNTLDVFEALILIDNPSVLPDQLTLSVSGTVNSISVG